MKKIDNKKKSLGMSPSTASAQLRKIILFDFVKKLNLDICYRCGQRIETINDLTIDHKTPWLHKENALELFLDINNIAFSHHRCNCAATSVKKYTTEEEKRSAKQQRNRDWRKNNTQKYKEQRKDKYQRTGT